MPTPITHLCSCSLALEQLNSHAVDLFNLYSLHQHVSVPTHVSGNVLDLILSQDGDVSSPLVSSVSVQSVCFSDHHLLTCHLGVPQTPPVVMTYSYRSLRTMDTPSATTSCDRNCSRPLQQTLTNTQSCSTPRLDECWTYTRLCEQVDADAASTTTVVCRRRPVAPNSYVVDLSVGTVGLDFYQTSRPIYLSACSAARDSILRSRADRIKSELDEVSGDVGASPGEQHRDCFTASTRLSTTTLSARS